MWKLLFLFNKSVYIEATFIRRFDLNCTLGHFELALFDVSEKNPLPCVGTAGLIGCLVSTLLKADVSRGEVMADEQKPEEIVRIYRDPGEKDRFLVEVLGEPISALKQMKREPFILEERKDEPKAE